MNAHKNARTTPFGRAVMCVACSRRAGAWRPSPPRLRSARAPCASGAPAFAAKADAGLESRSSAPHLVANKLPAPWLAMIARLRREYRMTGEEIAGRLQPATQHRRQASRSSRRGPPGRSSSRASRRGATTALAPASSSTSMSRSSPASGASAIGSPAIGAATSRGRRLGVRPRGG